MYQVEDEPVETIHLYVVREGQNRPSLVPVILSIVALCLLIAIGIVTPYKQPEERTIMRVPAILFPLKTFTTSVSVLPTGVKTYPATKAHGTLTITNGSIISQELPQGMIFTSKEGVEVITDQAVFVPAGNATGYGVATVSAHAARAGAAGNIQTLDIDTVEGSSIYIRNRQPFTGGADSYSVKLVIAQDKQNALSQARSILIQQTISGLLQSPCRETISGRKKLSVIWTCQFVRYDVPDLPGMKVLHASVVGKFILLEVVYLARLRILTAK